jgi:UDP-glucose 4-epimerase
MSSSGFPTTPLRCVITSGAGFIGGHLARRLAESGHQVTAVDRARRFRDDDERLAGVRRVACEPDDIQSLRHAAEGCDILFHLAGPVGMTDGARAMELESAWLRDAAQVVLDQGVGKLVYASTCAVYGDARQELDVDETVPATPSCGYGAAKRQGEAYLAALHERNGLQSVSLRYFNAYGPYQHPSMVVPRFLAGARAGEPLVIIGDGSQIRDFVHIDDVVEATIRAGVAVEGCAVLNVAGGEACSVTELARRVIAATGSPSDIVHRPVPPERRGLEIGRRVGDASLLRRLTGFRPAIGLDEGLARTLTGRLRSW